VRDAERVLREGEDVIPQPRLEVVLGLGQVEVRTAAPAHEIFRVVEEVQAEVDQRAGCRGGDARRIDVAQVLLDQVPAARAHHDGRGVLGSHRVVLALGARELELPADRVEQGHLPADHVGPCGAGGVFLVSQPDLGTRVQGVDRHLRVGRSGDLDPAVLEAGSRASDLPTGILADAARLVEEAQVAPVVDRRAPLHPGVEAVVAAAGELVVQPGEEGKRLGSEDLVGPLHLGAGARCGEHLHAVVRVHDRVSFGSGRLSGTARTRSSPRARGSRCRG